MESISSNYAGANAAREQTPLEEAHNRLSSAVSRAEMALENAAHRIETRLAPVCMSEGPQSPQPPSPPRIGSVARGGSEAVRACNVGADELDRILDNFTRRFESVMGRLEI